MVGLITLESGDVGVENSVTNSDTFTLMVANNAFAGAFSNVASGPQLAVSVGSGSFLVSYNGNTLTLTDYMAALRSAG